MTGDGARRLSDALEGALVGKENAAEQVPALLGCVIGGQKTIVVNDDPDYVWCRISGNESRRVKAFNQHAGGVAQHYDLPVIIMRDKLNPSVWKVVGRDVTRYPSWGQVANYNYSSPYLAHHGADHSFSSQAGMGADPVWVFKRQMMPLLPHPAISGSMGIEIGSDFYYHNGAYRWFASTGTVDFTSYMPTGASNGKFVTVYIDGNTGNPAYLDGGEFNAITPPIDPGTFISIPDANQGVAVAAVFLLSGTARLGWGEIYDLRHPHTPVPGTGTWFNLYDEATLLGTINEIHVEGGTISAAITGSVGYIASTAQTVTVISGSFMQETTLADITLLAPTGSFQVPSISQDYDRLKLILTARVVESGGGGVARGEIIWNDVTGSYASVVQFWGGSVGNGVDAPVRDAEDGPIVFRIHDGGSGGATGTFALMEMDVNNYTITGTITPHQFVGNYPLINLGFQGVYHQEGVQYVRRYMALTSVAIKPEVTTDTFSVGSRLVILGVREQWLPTSVSLS